MFIDVVTTVRTEMLGFVMRMKNRYYVFVMCASSYIVGSCLLMFVCYFVTINVGCSFITIYSSVETPCVTTYHQDVLHVTRTGERRSGTVASNSWSERLTSFELKQDIHC